MTNILQYFINFLIFILSLIPVGVERIAKIKDHDGFQTFVLTKY